MGISLSGFNSGLPVNDIITQLMQVERRPIELLEIRKEDITKEKSRFSEIQSKVQSLQKAIEAMTTTSLNKNPFKAKLASYPAGFEDVYKSIASATVGETASPQSIQLKVINTATNTKAASLTGVGQTVQAGTLTTSLAQGGLTGGSFTVYVGGVPNTITVADDGVETVDDVLQQIRDIGGGAVVDAQIVGNKIELSFAGGTDVKLGAANDTSNFLKVTHLQTGTKTATDITSSADILLINTGALMSDASSNLNTLVTDGTFTINNATFNTTGKTLNQVITDINNNSSAGVTASFNYATNQLQLTSKTAGSSQITLANGTSNFLSAMGLVNGADTTSSQTAGSNASFELNGALMYSASNTVDESVTGLTGVTLNLLKGDPGTTVTINVESNNTEIKKQIEDFVKKYNEVIAFIDVQTDAENGGVLVGESSLMRFRQKLRQMVSERVPGLSATAYQSLRDVGISTGAVTSAGNADPSLKFVSATLDAALADNPDIIRQLFVGTTATDGFDGVMTRLETEMDNALLNDGTSKGMFAAYDDTASRRLKTIDESIDRAELRLEKKEAFYKQQFLTMERMIGQYQSQGNALNGLIQQLSANK